MFKDDDFKDMALCQFLAYIMNKWHIHLGVIDFDGTNEIVLVHENLHTVVYHRSGLYYINKPYNFLNVPFGIFIAILQSFIVNCNSLENEIRSILLACQHFETRLSSNIDFANENDLNYWMQKTLRDMNNI